MSATWYLGFTVSQEPFDLGVLDGAGRQQCCFNLAAHKRPSLTTVEEIETLLELAGVGVRGVSIFGTTGDALLPDGDGPFLTLRLTAGVPKGTLNDGAAAYRRPGLFAIAHAKTWAAAYSMANAAFEALVGARNRWVSQVSA